MIGENHVANRTRLWHVTIHALARRLDLASRLSSSTVAPHAALVIKVVVIATRTFMGIVAGRTGDPTVAFLKAPAQLQTDGLKAGYNRIVEQHTGWRLGAMAFTAL